MIYAFLFILIIGAYLSTSFYIIWNGALISRRYTNEIIRQILFPYAVATGDKFILKGKNFRPYRANLIYDFLSNERIVQIE